MSRLSVEKRCKITYYRRPRQIFPNVFSLSAKNWLFSTNFVFRDRRVAPIHPSRFPLQMTLTLITLLLTVAMFVWGRWRGDITALAALCVLMLSGILTPTEALAGFSSPVVIMMAGLFIVGGAIVQTGLARAAGGRLMSLARGSETRALVLVLLSTSVIGAFVSNTGTVALMMPIIVSMAAAAGFHSSRLLMPLAFAGSLGGMLTLIGTPPNLVVNEALAAAGMKELGFFSFTPVGLIVIAIGILMLLPLSRLLVKKRKGQGKTQKGKSPDDLAREYGLEDNLYKYGVPASSAMVGKTVAELDLNGRFGLTILEVRNEKRRVAGLVRDVSQTVASGQTVIEAGDIVFLMGDAANAARLAAEYGLRRMKGARLDFYDIGLAEIVVLPGSRLEGTLVRDSRLKEKYNVSVLGIRRGNNVEASAPAPGRETAPEARQHVGEERLHGGDVLLVQAQWDDLAQLNSDSRDWVVLGHPEKSAGKVTLDYKAPLAAVIMLLMIVAMVAGWTQPVTAVLMAAVLTIVCGCFRSVDAAYKTINWESIILIGAMMPMSTALEKTGASALVSGGLVSALGGVGPMALLAGIYFTTSLLTMFISNTATAVLMMPIAMTAAQQTGVSPYAFLMAVTLGASMCFASPFSTPPNALVMKAGGYTFTDYVKVGLPLQVVIGIVMTFVLPLLFPF